MNKIINRNIDRYYYLILLSALYFGYLIANILSFYYTIFRVYKKREKDIILFPYAQPGSDGYKRRFEVYISYLEKDKIKYKICDLISNDDLIKSLEGSKRSQYAVYRKLFYKRLKQVLLAKKYKAAFIQRGLFVAYPDQRYPYLEKLLSKLNSNITIDFWDSFWVYNNKLVDKAASYCHKISCVNEFVITHFNFLPQSKYLFPIGVETKPYLQKKDYSINGHVRFIYTGLPANVENFMTLLSPVFGELNTQIDFTLVLITRHRMRQLKFPVEYHDFEESSFYNLLISADIGLYAVENSEISKGKMAMKVMDYMAAALPTVASPYGITPYAVEGENILFAKEKHEWINQILRIVSDKKLREQIGLNGYKTIEQHHNIDKSYKVFLDIMNR